MSFIVIIPARFASTRLPGKPLVDILGIPMVVRVMEQAKLSGAQRVIVATDHQQIVDIVQQYGGEACLTKENHCSGTERLAEVIEQYQFDDQSILVNVQGDEPLIPPAIINQVAKNLVQHPNIGISTLAIPLQNIDEIFDPNIVKVVRNQQNCALYFSRAPIPWDRENFPQVALTNCKHYLRHIGLYAYKASFVKQYVSWQASPLENIELLEQLRVLWYGEKIHVDIAKEVPEIGVDTPQDLQRIVQLFKERDHKNH